jgi:hypothetical protein
MGDPTNDLDAGAGALVAANFSPGPQSATDALELIPSTPATGGQSVLQY